MVRQDDVLKVLLPALASGKVALCPRCCRSMFTRYEGTLSTDQEKARREGWWPTPPAVSRTDNKTFVCSSCGTEEALEDAIQGRVLERTAWGPRFLDDPDRDNERQGEDNE